MAKAVPSRSKGSSPITEPIWIRWGLIFLAAIFLGLFLFLPLLSIFMNAFQRGIHIYLASFKEQDALAAIRLTLLASMVALILNLLFGLSAAWAIGKFDFRGKSLLSSIIDLPFSISPVVAGVIYIIIYGRQGWLGPFFLKHNVQIIFAVPGIVLATLFVTFPFVTRAILPLMEEQGRQQEEAAMVLGASGWRTFFSVTLPNIKWALLYGLVLCNARAMGEFGAVSVVSGHIRGQTNTVPLYIEILYNEYNFTAAFAISTLLTFLALVTLAAKAILEWKSAWRRSTF